MFRYTLVEGSSFVFHNKQYQSYGILAWHRTVNGWQEVAIAPDISCDRNMVLNLAEQCTRLQLDPIHLLDVVMDAIS